jgi:hypothetical protein
VVVDGHRESLLGDVLADDVLVQELADLHRLGQLVPLEVGALGELLLDDLVAEVDALVADVDAGPAMSFLTCFWLLPQKEHLSRSPPSPMRATSAPLPLPTGRSGPGPCEPRRYPEEVPGRFLYAPTAAWRVPGVATTSNGW